MTDTIMELIINGVYFDFFHCVSGKIGITIKMAGKQDDEDSPFKDIFIDPKNLEIIHS